MAVVKAFHKFSDWLDRVCGVLCVVCIAAMVILTGAQIVFRLYFTALYWSDEVTRYLLVWATFLAVGSVYRRAGHISVTLVQDRAPERVRTAMRVLGHILCEAFFILAVVYGLKYAGMQSRQLSAALRIPMSRVYLAIPVGCAIAAVQGLDRILDTLVRPTEKKEADA